LEDPEKTNKKKRGREKEKEQKSSQLREKKEGVPSFLIS